MKRYLLDTKRVGTGKETRVNDDENLSFFLWLIIYSRENSSWTVLKEISMAVKSRDSN
jgi:hypothetical protein